VNLESAAKLPQDTEAQQLLDASYPLHCLQSNRAGQKTASPSVFIEVLQLEVFGDGVLLIGDGARYTELFKEGRGHAMRLKSSFLCWALVLGLLTPGAMAVAEDHYNFIIQKQEKKEKNRWSLQEWLDTRDRMRMMDLWLALHSPSPYEFYVSTLYRTGNVAAGGYYGGWNLQVAAYAYLFGVEVQRDWSNSGDRWLGVVNFRIFGFHNQATNLTLQGGLVSDSRSGTETWNGVAGAHMTLYLSKGFGVTGLYRYRFPKAAAVQSRGSRAEAGAFIDFRFVRVLGEYFAEIDSASPQHSYTGIQFGLRAYL
jgi:hypothetical protein